MSKIVKSFKKAVKKVVGGVKKIWKKVTSSTIGKIILIAAAIYLSGGAMGAWNTPWASVNGAWTATGSQAAQAAAAENATSAALTESVVTEGALTEGVVTEGVVDAGATNIVEPLADAASLSDGVAVGGELTAQELASGVITPVTHGTSGSLIGDALSTMGGLIADNQTLAIVGGMGVMNALTPDALDVEKERQRQEERDLIRRNKNWDVSSVDTGIRTRRTRKPLITGVV